MAKNSGKDKDKTTTGKTGKDLYKPIGGGGNFLKSILGGIANLLNSLLGLKKKNKLSFSL
jgi:hypothetical protein